MAGGVPLPASRAKAARRDGRAAKPDRDDYSGEAQPEEKSDAAMTRSFGFDRASLFFLPSLRSYDRSI